MQKAYRLLVKIHEECAAVIAIIESTGKAEREINEINDLVILQHLNHSQGGALCISFLYTDRRWTVIIVLNLKPFRYVFFFDN